MKSNFNKFKNDAKKILASHPKLKYSVTAKSTGANIPGGFCKNMKVSKRGKIDLLKVVCILLFITAVILLCCKIKREIKKIFGK